MAASHVERCDETARQADRTRGKNFQQVYDNAETVEKYGLSVSGIPDERAWTASERKNMSRFGTALCTTWGLWCLDGGPTMDAAPETVDALIRALGDARAGAMKMNGTNDDGEVGSDALEVAAIKMIAPAMQLWLSGWLDNLRKDIEEACEEEGDCE